MRCSEQVQVELSKGAVVNEENKEAIPQPAMDPAAQPAAMLVSEPAAVPVAHPTPAPQPEAASAVAAQPAPTPALEPQPAPTSEVLSVAAPAQPMAEPADYRQPSGVAVPVSVKPGGTASLVCGILAAALGFFIPIAGLVLGIIAIVQAKKWPGSGKAKAGRICGIIGIVLAALSFILGIVAMLVYTVM